MPLELYWIPAPWPGKLAVAARPRGGDWLSDDIAAWQRAGIETVLSTLTKEEEKELDLSQERAEAEAHSLRFLSLPILDFQVPISKAAVAAMNGLLRDDLTCGNNVVIHCRQGIGRSGLIAACLLIDGGLPVEEVLRTLSSARGLPVPETEEQCRWLQDYSK